MLYYCSFGAVCGFAAAVATDTTTPLHKIIFLVGPCVCGDGLVWLCVSAFSFLVERLQATNN